MKPGSLIVFCGVLLSTSAFSVDIVLPFFPSIRDDLAAPQTAVQATVTLYLLCLGAGQLLFGSLSDRIGRRGAIAGGLGLYLAGALIALTSSSITGLLAGRALQGFGAAAGPVVGRAIIRDLFTGQALAQNMAIATGIFSVGPIFAPLLGAAIAAGGAGWRAVFVVMGLFAAGLLVTLARVPETNRHRRPDALAPTVMARNALTVLRHPQSRYFLVLGGVTSSAMVCIVAGSPVVFEHAFGVRGAAFALLFATHGLGIIIGQFANHRMIARIGPVASAMVAASVMTAAFALSTAAALAGWQSAPLQTFLIFVFALGYLIVVANATSLTLEPHGPIAGFVSAFFGFASTGAASLIATAVLAVTAGDLLAWSTALALISFVVLIALRVWHRRGGPAARPGAAGR
ncbi:MAG TPA: MFS transporter [Burkholderiaceae bacterium]|nr:MFS transporter [Burkholderiaceae bacterium]